MISALNLKDDLLPRRAVAQRLPRGERKAPLSKLLSPDQLEEFNQLLKLAERKPLALNSVKASDRSKLLLQNVGSRTERNLSNLPHYGAMIVKSNLEPLDQRKYSKRELGEKPRYFIFNDIDKGDIHQTSRLIDSAYL